MVGELMAEKLYYADERLPDRTGSETNLTEDSLASDQLGGKANYKAKHC